MSLTQMEGPSGCPRVEAGNTGLASPFSLMSLGGTTNLQALLLSCQSIGNRVHTKLKIMCCLGQAHDRWPRCSTWSTAVQRRRDQRERWLGSSLQKHHTPPQRRPRADSKEDGHHAFYGFTWYWDRQKADFLHFTQPSGRSSWAR